MELSVVALAKHENTMVIAERVAEDIWLLDDGSIVSFLDLFIHTNKDSPAVKSLELVILGRIRYITDVSHWFEKFAEKWKDSVASDQYDKGVYIHSRAGVLLYMFIGGLDANVSLHKGGISLKGFTTPIGRSGTIVNLVFNPPIKADETRALKICYYVPKLAQKEDGSWCLHLYPYHHWGVGGAGYLKEKGVDEENLVEVSKYYIQVIPPTGFDLDLSRTTEVYSVDETPCDNCQRFCPYTSFLFKDIRVVRTRRLFVRWKLENLKRWDPKNIIHFYYYSKPEIARVILEKIVHKIEARHAGLAAYILWTLEVSSTPLTAKKIYENITARGERITLAGIHYKLKQLKSQGLIQSIREKPKDRGRPPQEYKITENGRRAIGF